MILKCLVLEGLLINQIIEIFIYFLTEQYEISEYLVERQNSFQISNRNNVNAYLVDLKINKVSFS